MGTLLQKPGGSRARVFVSLTFTTIMLLCACPTLLAQSPKANRNLNHLTRELTYEDVYFNADGRQVSSTASLSAAQMSATSIGSVLSLLFDSARVELQSANDPMVATWSGTITVPTNTTIKPAPKVYQQDIRGSVTKTADTRVTIVFNLGGKSFIVDFPYGTKRSGNLERKFISLAKLSAPGSYTVSMFILAERRNAKGAVLIDIDGLDIDAR